MYKNLPGWISSKMVVVMIMVVVVAVLGATTLIVQRVEGKTAGNSGKRENPARHKARIIQLHFAYCNSISTGGGWVGG